MLIRKAQKDEIGALQLLDDEIFQDSKQYDPDLILEWGISDEGKNYFVNLLGNSNVCCFVAEEKGKLIGYISAAPKDFSYRKSKYIEIQNMGVSPRYRSKGVGSLLMEECLKWARTQGFEKAYVNAYFHNRKGLKFYKSSGFKEIDISLERKI